MRDLKDAVHVAEGEATTLQGPPLKRTQAGQNVGDLD